MSCFRRTLRALALAACAPAFAADPITFEWDLRTRHEHVTDGAEVNQAWVGWKNARFTATVGRQRLIFDNARWVANSGWRQNEQTFDAVALGFKANDALSLRYAWLDKLHRVSGDDARHPLARERDLSRSLDCAGRNRRRR